MESAEEVVPGKKREPRRWEKIFSNQRSDGGEGEQEIIAKTYRKSFNSAAKTYAAPSQRFKSADVTSRQVQVACGYEKAPQT